LLVLESSSCRLQWFVAATGALLGPVLPELYPAWGEALLVALEQFHGDDWSDVVSRQWREAFEPARALMVVGYQAPLHV
jgi:hypothetical protein